MSLSILVALAFGAQATALERPQGLLWNRSGLPATIPLQIKTTDTADYLLRLRGLDSGEMALAAYIRGGDFFRVLVPPGVYELIFASGREWQGETLLFGTDTDAFQLEPPLRFVATATRREGYLIDLRTPEAITIRSLATCDRRALDPDSLTGPRTPEDYVIGPPERRDRPERPDKIPFARYEVQGRFCD
ncbi:hypothetical protein [Shimia sp. MMG029]|uniref:hypothetical protein n=1 Tax=Shimia sp. MMG029 TaxID=3021978 RepID=UPI0022FF25A4|nr:hypothetical protein [Shimia sp. MMG029]MDA5556133.1 hypothetical protein [Shimia sp. MMG029]